MRAAGAAATSAPSMPAPISVRDGGVALEWSAVKGADGYRVYRKGGGNDASWRTMSTRFVDKNERGGSDKPPTKGSVWTVKNLLELKNAQKVVIDGNLFEHHWAQAQAGHAILFTPRNQGGRAPWSRVGDIRFTNNVVRGVSAGINISGTDDEKPSVRTSGIVIENNLFLDVGGAMWGEPGDFLLIGNGPENVRIERNTVMQTGRAVLAYGGRHGLEVPGFVFRNNVLRHNRYGIFGTDAGIGKPALAKYFPGGVFEGNVFAGGAAKEYPAGNQFLAVGALDDQLVADGAGYRWKSAEAVRGAGADFSVLRTTVQAAQAAPPRSKG
jgi:hypothetical protein